MDNPSREMSKWTTISTRLVEPDIKKEPEWVEWSPLDTMWFAFYSSYVFLYKPKSEVEYGDGDSVLPINRVMESLGKALVPFYPFAGRLFKERTDKYPRLHCNNEGALFTHKRYDGVASDLIDENQFQPNDLLSGLRDIDPTAETFDPSGLPTLIIQKSTKSRKSAGMIFYSDEVVPHAETLQMVTDFQCGARCLNASWSHAIADGFSSIHFLKSWAQISRGEPITLMPVHNRSLLTRRKSSRILDGAPARLLNICNDEEEKTDKIQLSISDGIRCKSINFSRRMMDELKAEGLGDVHGKALSTAHCVSAYLWRSVMELRKREPYELTMFGTLVNARSRIKDVPPGYFGNCVIITTSVVKVVELLSQPLGNVATVIHDAIKSVDEELVRDWIDWLSVNRFRFSALGDESFMVGDPKRFFDMFCCSWMNRFPFYEMDFGFGKPSAVLRNAFRYKNTPFGMFFVIPRSTEGDISISFCLDKSVLDELHDHL